MAKKGFLEAVLRTAGMLSMVLVFGMMVTACTTTSVSGGRDVQGRLVDVQTYPAKDFISLGMVFAETVVEDDGTGDKGDIMTYNALLKEAQAIEADTIINVVIDSKFEGSETKFFLTVLSRKGKTTWYGSATAIKYTDTLVQKTTDVTIGNGSVANTKTIETPVMSGGSSSGGGISSNSDNGDSDTKWPLFKPSTWSKK
jgi:hypothetical protein